MAVAWGAVDCDAVIHQPLARRIDIPDAVGQMAEIAPAIIAAFVPVMCQFDLRIFIARRC